MASVGCAQVFLKALGGRLKPSSELRWSGEVKYNGLTTQEFCVERAIGLVDQYDDHLPMMTVRETLVRKCCYSPEGVHVPVLLRNRVQMIQSETHICPTALHGFLCQGYQHQCRSQCIYTGVVEGSCPTLSRSA